MKLSPFVTDLASLEAFFASADEVDADVARILAMTESDLDDALRAEGRDPVAVAEQVRVALDGSAAIYRMEFDR